MPGGRSTKPITYTTVEYNGKKILVGQLNYKNELVKFICDNEYESVVKSKHWHVVPGNYIGFNYINEETNTKRVKYVHTFILEETGYAFKGDDYIINHINSIGFDNRMDNLREIKKSLHNRIYQVKEKYTAQLPDEIDASEIPRNISYKAAYGNHGDRFVVEIKGIPGVPDIEIKTTSSKSVEPRIKLEEAIAIRNEQLEKYPDILEFYKEHERIEEMKKIYNEIIRL